MHGKNKISCSHS